MRKDQKYLTAQQWLNAAVKKFRSEFFRCDADLPVDIQVSVGWIPCKSNEKIGCYTGQAWPEGYASDKKTCTIFISPDIFDPIEVLETLCHELIHLTFYVGCACNHEPPFSWLAEVLGLLPGEDSGWGQTEVGPKLKRSLRDMSRKLGRYPWISIEPYSVR